MAIYFSAALHTSYSYFGRLPKFITQAKLPLKLFVCLCRDQKTDQRTELFISVNTSVIGLLKLCAFVHLLSRVQTELKTQGEIRSQSLLAYLLTTLE